MTVDEILARAGIGPNDQGRYVAELRIKIAQDVANGTISRGWSWGPKAYEMSADDRARYILSVDWHIDRGHSYRQEVLDPIVDWSFKVDITKDISEWKRFLRIRWHRMPAWLGDRYRQLGMHYRIWRDRGRNPYEAESDA